MIKLDIIVLVLFLASFGSARELSSGGLVSSPAPGPCPSGRRPVETGVRLTSCARPGVWALTFDDGPSTELTPMVLDALKDNNVQASFFVVGGTVIQNEESKRITLRAFNEGHLIGSHSYSHPDFTQLNTSQVREELSKASDALYSVIGRRPKYFRPPYGYTNDEVEAVLKEEEYKIVIWNMDPRDWESRDPAKILAFYEEVVGSSDPAENNILSLSHDTVPATAEVVPDLISIIRSKGFELVRVDDCFSDSDSPYW